MAPEEQRRRRDGALGVVGAVTIGAIAASFVSPAAFADDPGFPSWADVQAAKADKAAAEAESTRITALLADLQDRSDAAGRTAEIAVGAVPSREARGGCGPGAALRAREAGGRRCGRRRTSRMRAGLLAASVAEGAEASCS